MLHATLKSWDEANLQGKRQLEKVDVDWSRELLFEYMSRGSSTILRSVLPIAFDENTTIDKIVCSCKSLPVCCSSKLMFNDNKTIISVEHARN